jgi:phosphomannomutase
MYSKTHQFTASILKMYDIRGIVGEDLDNTDAYFMGKAYGTFLRNLGKNSCSVGIDGRVSSEELKKWFIDGLITTGIDAYDIGLAMSPCLYWSVWYLNVDAGIIITASHNPPEYNGFKMLTKEDPIWGDDIQKIGKIAESGKFAIGNGKIFIKNIKNDYIKYILSFLKLTPQSKHLNIVFDTGNGVVSDVIHDVAKHIPGNHKFLYDTVDGRFPNHLPDPSLESEMQDLKHTVINEKYDLGISYDGDGDRLGFIDREGYIYFGDEILDFLMRDFLKEYPGEKVLFEISSSQILVDDIKKFGGIPIMWKPGHSTIKAKMKEDNIKIAGETSCHIYYGENHNFDDSLVATMKLINILANTDETLENMRKNFPKTYSTRKIKVKTQDDIVKYTVPNKIASRMKSLGREVIQIDGARVYTNHTDWWLIRSSNTEPAMTARAEAMTANGLKICENELKEQLNIEGFDIEFGHI